MERYTVTIITPASSAAPPTLLVPFSPSAIVTAFVDELFKRIARQGLALAPNTHIATLHVDSENGAIIDVEDVLESVINPSKDKLYAVFTAKQGASSQIFPVTTSQLLPGEKTISVRIITPATAQGKGSPVSTLQLPASTTVKQLHEIVAQKLGTSATFASKDDLNHCNCALARQLADADSAPSQYTLVHGKSKVERIELGSQDGTEDGLKASVRGHIGQYFEANQKMNCFGGQFHANSSTSYKKTPVVAVCSKLRHVPAHARTVGSENEQTDASRAHVLDLHTKEIPIHSGSHEATLEQAGLSELAVDGVVDIFVVERATSGTVTLPPRGRDSIFRSHPHWEPPTVQGDRATAMFLSSLRVFASNVEKPDKEKDNFKDAVLHVFDLLTKFPPAVRALHILINGKTPTPTECAALSHAVYETLDRIVPTALIGTTHARVFEGSRLLFGFFLEKARSLKLPNETQSFPYLTALKEVELADKKTKEAVMHAQQTTSGLIERVDGSPEDDFVSTDGEIRRLALLSAGSTQLLLTFGGSLASNYHYADAGDASCVWEEEELHDMHALAEFCGRNKLAVHKPSQLAGAVAPCLTFDRRAHLAVYTGQEGCGADPSKSTLTFRPMRGSENVDVAVIEQLIASVLKRYEADGTAVFDALGGAAVRRLHAPDEICKSSPTTIVRCSC
ncbi:hypothetical protein LTR10_009974 [Elasticomyces elasticus]|nr:hypothetical protein LTR10_009974 [Elasticomyces elasticus]KAK4970266.1 hypothetical protein LTR42_008433 [Elasticomyces elasticus]